MSMYEEPCPYCDETVGVDLPHDWHNLETTCTECGKSMLVCSACPINSFCDWSPKNGCSMDSNHLVVWTYPNMYTDRKNGIENEDYDDEVKVFSVPLAWAEKWLREIFKDTVDDFMDEYTWDDSLYMYEAARTDGVIAMEYDVGREENGREFE